MDIDAFNRDMIDMAKEVNETFELDNEVCAIKVFDNNSSDELKEVLYYNGNNCETPVRFASVANLISIKFYKICENYNIKPNCNVSYTKGDWYYKAFIKI